MRKTDQIFKLESDKKPGNVFNYQYDARGNLVEMNNVGEPNEKGELHNLRTLFHYNDAGHFSDSVIYVNGELVVRQKFKHNAKGETIGLEFKQYDKGVLQSHVSTLMYKDNLEYIYYGLEGQIDRREIFSRKPYQLTLEEDYSEGKKQYQTEYKDGKATFATQYKTDGTVEWKKPVNSDGSVSFTFPEPEKTD